MDNSAFERFFLPAKATITVTPSILLVSQQVLAANPLRRGLMIYNNSANTVYIACDTTCSSANHMSFPILTFATFTFQFPIYCGPLAAIRNAGSGTLLITEMTSY